MNSLLNVLKSLLPAIESQHDSDEAYMAAAADVQDLERRMRDIDQRGRRDWAPITYGLYAR